MYVVGGNHSYNAVSIVRKNFPNKNWFKEVNISLWWWEKLTTSVASDIENLAVCHNTDNNFRKKMSFLDKVQLLRRKYNRAGGVWKAIEKESAMVALGYKTQRALDPLLQLVAGPKVKFEKLMYIIKEASSLKLGVVNSDAPFRCLAGKLTEEDQIDLLSQVADGKLTLKAMAAEAKTRKILAIIKEQVATYLNVTHFDEAFQIYGDRLSDIVLKSFISQYSHLKKSEMKQPTRQLTNYLEKVRTTDLSKAVVEEEVFRIDLNTHQVFTLDVKFLSKLVDKVAKPNISKLLLI